MRVRPFEHYFEQQRQGPAVAMTGRVEPRSFVVTAFGHTARLAVTEVGRDRGGDYAVLAGEQTVGLAGGFRLEALVEHDEDFGDGVELRLVCDQESRRRVSNTARASGVNPDQVNLVAPADAVFSVYFHPDGTPEGASLVRREPQEDKDEPVH